MRFIEKAKFVNFRCYGEDVEEMVLADLNIIAGQNNSGKSALLTALRRLPSVNVDREQTSPQEPWARPTDLHVERTDLRDSGGELKMVLTLGQDLRVVREIMAPWDNGRRSAQDWKARDLIAHDQPLPTTLDVSFVGEGRAQLKHGEDTPLKLLDYAPIVSIPERRSLHLPTSLALPKHEPGVEDEIVTADHLLPTLLDLHHEDASRLRMCCEFAQEVLGCKLGMAFRPSEPTLLVKEGEEPPRRLPDLGAGITNVLVLALALAKYEGGLLLYEEPELHLHPSLQRRILDLLRWQATERLWQIIVTTHSNHILDLAPTGAGGSTGSTGWT